MRLLATVLLFLAPPFWEAKSPDKWTDREVEALRNDSPWAQSVGPDPKVLVYLASAEPIEDAEGQARLRAKNPLAEPDPDYLDYLRENREKHFVLAVNVPPGVRWSSVEERRMEEGCTMVVGKRTHKIIGHFPPTPSDPVLLLIFPRDTESSDKSVVFRLYVPGLVLPEREVEFRVKEMMYHGKLAM